MNSGEGLLEVYPGIQDPDLLEDVSQRWDTYWGPILMMWRNPALNGSDFGPHDVEYAKAAREFQFYLNGSLTQDTVPGLVDLITDTSFTHGIYRMALSLSPS